MRQSLPSANSWCTKMIKVAYGKGFCKLGTLNLAFEYLDEVRNSGPAQASGNWFSKVCSDLVLLPVFCAALTTLHSQPPRSVNFCWYRFSVCLRPLYPDRDCSDFTVIRNVRKEAQSKKSPTCSNLH